MQYLNNFDYNDIDKGIETLKNCQINFYPTFCNDNNIIIYHVYWYGILSRKQLLCIKSYLATQNLEKTKLYVWLDFDNGYNQTNIDLIPTCPNIEIKSYNPKIESQGTPFEKKSFIFETHFLKFRSDCARMIFLYKYGGIYYDLDMILLKDLMPLLGIEFCYSWADKKFGNNGILRLMEGSNTCSQLMNKYIEVLKTNRFTIKLNSKIFTSEIKIVCLPSVLFDPVWILFDKKITSKYSLLNNFDNFFKKTNEKITINTFFVGVIFAYHWHSRNNMEIELESYFEQLETDITKMLNVKC